MSTARSTTFAMCAWSILFLRNRRHRTSRIAVLVAVAASAVAAIAARDPLPPCRRTVPDPASSVRWVVPSDAASEREQQRWCASVGPALLDARPASPPASTDLDTLTVVSWNVHVGAGDVEGLVARLRRGDFTDGRAVHDFVLLLQEEFRAGEEIPPVLPHRFTPPARIAPSLTGRTREDVHAFDAAHSWTVFYVPSMRNGRLGHPAEDRGNAIVSTMPLQDPTAIELPLERQRRVAIAATVRGRSAGGPWTLRLVDVHLDTALALLHGGPFGVRRRQAEALVSAVAGDAPALVAGDFNTWGGSGEPALTVFERAFPLSDLHGRARNTAPTFAGPLGWHAVLDHVFARGVRDIGIRRLDDRFGSDHYPLLVEVRF